MFKLLKRFIGSKESVQINADPFGKDVDNAAESVNKVAESVKRTVPAAVLQRDEILDDRTRITGYRLSALSSDSASPLYARATLEVLRDNNVAGLAERRLTLIPILAEQWVQFDFRPLIGPRTTFLLELPATSGQLGGWSDVARAMRISGAAVAVHGAGLSQHHGLIGALADIVMLDFTGLSLQVLEQNISALKADQPQLKVMVENLTSWSEFRYCMSHRVDYAMGPFTTMADDEVKTSEVGSSRLVLIEMLNQLRQEADLSEISQVAKRDPGVAVKLITMANSPMLGIAKEITSIDQAIVLLGRDQLYRWLSMAMFRTGTSSPRDEVLLELALARGRFLELVGQGRHSKAECDELFLLGLMSLLDSLLGIPMEKVVALLNLSENLKAVLLRSEGALGNYLLLVMATEKSRTQVVIRLSEQMGIPLAEIEAATSASLLWAEAATRMS